MKPLIAPVAALLIAALFSTAATADDALRNALKAREHKTATVLRVSGTELTGTVEEVSSESVKLKELSGRDFFDAVIDLDHVQAVIVRAR